MVGGRGRFPTFMFLGSSGVLLQTFFYNMVEHNFTSTLNIRVVIVWQILAQFVSTLCLSMLPYKDFTITQAQSQSQSFLIDFNLKLVPINKGFINDIP